MTTGRGDVMAKGVNFICAKKYIEKKYGKETWEQIMRSLSDEARAVWNDCLLAGSEYPFLAFKEMMSSLSSVLKTAKDAEIAAVYEYIADQSLNTMYKIFFRLAQPSFVIKNYPLLWSRFFNAGTVDVPAADKGHASVRFLLPDVFDNWLPPACLGYSKKAVAMAGGGDLTVKRTSYEKKPAGVFESVYELRWKE
jgi:hypothetical protein